MVSHQPSSASTTAASRRRKQRPRLAPSRAERLSQFPVDASSYVRKDEYPIFAHTGDVEITIRGAIAADGVETVSNTYLLHQHILARCSGFFAASTSSQWSKAQPDSASGNERARDIGDDGDRGGGGGDKDGGGSSQNSFGSTRPTRRWKYELNHEASFLDAPMLFQTESFLAAKGGSARAGDSQPSSSSLSAPGSGGPVASQPEDGPPARLNGSQRVFDAEPETREMLLAADEFLLRNYDNLFRIFYNCRPMLADADVDSAFHQCKSLLNLADQYDALAVVRPSVEHHLLQFQSSLWEAVAMIKRSYLQFSCMLRSKVIFKEALIHIVGSWYLRQERPKFEMPDSVLDTAERKVHELKENVSRVESQLFRLNLTTEQGEHVTPTNDYLGWLAVSLFRQWLADSTKPQIRESEGSDNHHSDDNNEYKTSPYNICRIFRSLGSKSPSAFLDHTDYEKFLALNPQLHTRENLVYFESRMADLKHLARRLVDPLLRSSLALDVDKFNASGVMPCELIYFTCSTIEDDEVPWPLEPYIPY
ncbi:hypothetical protein E4U48_005978 [Claviceps purpurea]|nr:hypothetical protein E4U51_005756 [Claviceps purpurea]KAG6265434.1 hypothetical protein E4U48_005978 [Claviceps purpurea]